jgi:hypothetical protein
MAAMTRRSRFLTAIAAAAALLFSQLAVSAYSCPKDAPSVAAAPEGCDESMGNANLCQSHCEYGSASFDAAKPLQAPQTAILPALRIPLPDVTVASLPAPAPRVAPGPSPPTPLSRFTVLRI